MDLGAFFITTVSDVLRLSVPQQPGSGARKSSVGDGSESESYLTDSDSCFVETEPLSVSDGVKDTSLKAKAKTSDFKIVLEDLRGRGLVLEDSNTAVYEYRHKFVSVFFIMFGCQIIFANDTGVFDYICPSLTHTRAVNFSEATRCPRGLRGVPEIPQVGWAHSPGWPGNSCGR